MGEQLSSTAFLLEEDGDSQRLMDGSGYNIQRASDIRQFYAQLSKLSEEQKLGFVPVIIGRFATEGLIGLVKNALPNATIITLQNAKFEDRHDSRVHLSDSRDLKAAIEEERKIASKVHV